MTVTGATDEQIKAAKDRVKDGTHLPLSYESEATIELIAGYLVPPDHRIIALDDLKRLRSGWADPPPAEHPHTVAFLEHIDALIAGREGA